MKYVFFLALLPAALIISGCSSTPTSVSSGSITATTFSFVAKNSADTSNIAEKRDRIHSMIQDSITRNLAGKGVSRRPAGGDVTVAYLVVVGNNVSTESINTYFGYGRDSSELQEKAHDAYVDNKNPNSFEAGTLLIDIIDSKTFKLLKRSYVARPLLRDVSPNVRAGRIQEAVDATLKDVRIGH